jgi:hypothetical protein
VIFYLQPTIINLVPMSGPIGGSVTVQGTHFDDLTSITIGGARVTKWDYVTSADTAINCEIPVGAVTGPIIVTNPGGSATSAIFTVTSRASAL